MSPTWATTDPPPEPLSDYELVKRYQKEIRSLSFVEHARYRQGYGAARNKMQRFMDRNAYWKWDGFDGRRGGRIITQDDYLTTPRPRHPAIGGQPVYPPSLSPPAKHGWRILRCKDCHQQFQAHRKDALRCRECKILNRKAKNQKTL